MEALDEYLTKLASDAPAPGGGSAAMVVGAAGCALVAMVARICAGSPKYAAVRERAARLADRADELRASMLARRVEDEAAFEAVVAARGNREASQRALERAAAVPLDGARQALEALELARDALGLGNKHLASDAGCAAEFAYAALAACAYNVRVNHAYMHDAQTVTSQRERLERCEREGRELLGRLRSAVSSLLDGR